jgi:outer membrane protein assembly factor BamD
LARNATTKFLGLLLATGVALLGASGSEAQILHKKKPDTSTKADNNVQPDKVLYDRAVEDVKHGRHEVGRLNLQTLINTYPDSEYLAKAKLLIADSYFKQGGTANMTQAISGYKDFIVFFPFLPEAAYAQLQVAMGHFQQMEKPDRDRTEAKEAESEFQTFLQKYPKDPLADKAMQHLREVQEVIAEGDYRVAYYYYTKGDRRAAAARLIGVTTRYPLYSRSDRALWMLGDIFEKSEKKEIAAVYYAQIVKNYPVSNLAANAKTKLVAMKVPVPQADPQARARMVADQNTPRPRVSLAKRPMGLLKSGPGSEMTTAARVGTPTLEQEADNTSATDVLTGGNSSRIVVGGSGTASTSGNATGIVATVTPGGAKTENGGTTDSGTAPADANTSGEAAPAGAPAPDSAAPPATGGGTEAAPAGTAPVGPGESSSATPPPGESSSAVPASGGAAATPAAGADGAAATAATPAASGEGSGTTGATGATGTTAPASTDAAAKTDAAQDDSTGKDDNSKESTSKKKKGLRKLVPW